jgi:hypothetical protein
VIFYVAAPTLHQACLGIMRSSHLHDLLMPSSSGRSLLKRKPPRGTIARYRDRIVEVLGAARGQRVMIRSIHPDGAERVTAVKLANLVLLDNQLF